MVRVIHACCVLHNMANMQNLQFFEASLDDQQPEKNMHKMDNKRSTKRIQNGCI